ncbi:hypothetical protein Tco_0309307 [Tanacetum coccineum]
MESQNKGTTTIKSCLKASQIRNIEGKTLGKDGKPLVPMRQAVRATNLGPGTKCDKGKEIQGGDAAPPVTSADGTYDKVVAGNVTSLGDKQKHVHVNESSCWEDPNVHAMKSSFVNIVSAEEEVPKLNFKTLISTSQAEDADCVLPVASVIDAQNKFENSPVGFFVGKSVAFQLFTSLSGMERVLEQGPWMIRNQPLILTKWSPNLNLSKDKVTKVPLWVKIHKVPVVAYSADGLSLIGTQIGKPILLDAFTSSMCKDPWGRIGYALALIEVSAKKELKKEVTMAIPIVNGVGHTIETMKVEYEWKPSCCYECHVFGHALENCPKRVVESAKETNVENEDGFTTVKSRKRKGKRADTVQARNFEGIKLSKPKPNFVWSVNDVVLNNSFDLLAEEDRADWNDEITWQIAKRAVNVINESDSEDDDQEIVLETHPGQYAKGASTLSKDVSHNSNNVDINVVSQDDQAMHARVWIKADKKEVFCSFIYAHNRYSQRRALWENLGKHKVYVRNRPWCLLGDFNAALNIEDKSMGSSNIDISMREFKECVDNIEVLDIPRSGLQYTWNQKPKESSGLLKKLDRVMANMEFNDAFVGAFAVFQPYRTSDHSPAVLKIPISAKGGPKPFKFTNFLTVKKLKYLKKPFRKLLYEKGNLHDNVERLRVELDQVQRDLDADPSNAILREEEAIYGETFTDENVAKTFFNHYKVFLGQPDQRFKEAMFSMGNDKAPGPDGYTAAFFKESWDIISKDVTMAVQEFFVNDLLSTDIKECLKGLISPNQSAFVPGRRISDNILLTQELMHNYHLDRGTPRCAFKVDIQKAYDTIDWEAKGLRQGDPLSPYLFTLIMEVFTLMLKRRARESPAFTYHRYCSDLELINLCFADDLFIFAHGDPESATVIMEDLDEFKNASGVPLVSSRLIYRDCKELIEKVQHRIRDWKNKSLSAAGRLQLVKSVIGSMHVYWASVFILPSRVLLDFEQLMRNFLWAQGESQKGKSKVAWEVVCLPMKEGGLGVHEYKLRGRNFFEVPFRGNMTWGWRKILQLRPLIRDHIWFRIGDGATCSLWFDKWCSSSPLASIVTSRDIHRAGLDMSSKVNDVIYNGGWAWPIELSSKYPLLSTIVVPTVSTTLDSLEWHSDGGVSMPFSVATVWNCLRPRDVVVPWVTIGFVNYCIHDLHFTCGWWLNVS